MRKIWSDGREARLRTANPATRVQIPFRPPFLNENFKTSAGIAAKEPIFERYESKANLKPLMNLELERREYLKQIHSL